MLFVFLRSASYSFIIEFGCVSVVGRVLHSMYTRISPPLVSR